MKILIVEDDRTLNDGIALSLCGSGSEALALQAYSLAEADKLLRIFTQNAGRTLTRDTLISRVWDDTEFVEENALSVTVKRLRGKLPGIPIKLFTV